VANFTRGFVASIFAGALTGALSSYALVRSSAAKETRSEGAAAAAARASAPPPSPAERAQEHRAALKRHTEEPVEPAWAPAAEASFERTLRPAGAALGFELRAVDCRSTSCVATLRFARYADAQARWGEILHMRYEMNCAREIVLDDPADPRAAFETDVLFDCAGARAGARAVAPTR
jgi:hypothetical protein